MQTWVHKAVMLGMVWSAAVAQHVVAGEISLQWDAVPGASGYHVYYGTQSGVYGQYVSVASNAALIGGLPDCQTYFVAVKAFNGAGESPTFSNEITGWPRPAVASASPGTMVQGDQLTLDLVGSNFQSGATVSVSPNRGTCTLRATKACSTDADCQPATEGICQNSVVLTSVSVLSCGHLQLLAMIEPTAPGIRPAQIGKIDVTVVNPDAVFGVKSQAFEVLVDPSRFDINRSDSATTNRIDGKDTIYLSRNFGYDESDSRYEPNDDFNGDGWVDGADLAFIASNLGRCWSTSSKSWTLAACPNNFQ